MSITGILVIREEDRGAVVERPAVGEVGGSVAVDQSSGGEDGGASAAELPEIRTVEESSIEVGGSGALGGRQRETRRKTVRGGRRNVGAILFLVAGVVRQQMGSL